MAEIVLRFVIGGAIVSAFAVLGDLLRPKSFAGLFGAAPSVALATLALTIAGEGHVYAAEEARSMMGGAIAFFAYACSASYVMMKYRLTARVATSVLILLWLGVAIGIWDLWLRY
jgi:uncharacterized membrane protein (GlpM family)